GFFWRKVDLQQPSQGRQPLALHASRIFEKVTVLEIIVCPGRYRDHSRAFGVENGMTDLTNSGRKGLGLWDARTRVRECGITEHHCQCKRSDQYRVFHARYLRRVTAPKQSRPSRSGLLRFSQ